MNFEEMKDWCNDAQRSLGRELDRLQEQQRTMDNHLQVLEAADELLSEIVRQKDELVQKQSEIDNMTEQLEQKDQEIMELRQQLLEAKNQQLESERQHLETEVRAKPMEIHNHFEPGSSSQVFNDQVSGKFSRNQNGKNNINRKRKDIKRNKKRWKKIVGKML